MRSRADAGTSATVYKGGRRQRLVVRVPGLACEKLLTSIYTDAGTSDTVYTGGRQQRPVVRLQGSLLWSTCVPQQVETNKAWESAAGRISLQRCTPQFSWQSARWCWGGGFEGCATFRTGLLSCCA